MKELRNGEKVPAHVYYYLLEFNDRDRKKILMYKFGLEATLNSLTRQQFIDFFVVVTHFEYQQMQGL